MIEQPWLQWAFTSCFAATGLFSAVAMGLDRGAVARIGHAWHLLMSAGMAAMVWPWGMTLAPGAQALLFLIATGWFTLLFAQETSRRRAGHAPGHPRWHQPYHALMMAAMAWMLWAMLPAEGASSVDHHHHHALPAWSALIGVGFLVAMLTGTAIFAVDASLEVSRVRRARRAVGQTRLVSAPRWQLTENSCQAAMSLGMAAMIVPMLAA